ncbi:ABC transporter ATP-binding protein [Thioclava sp.]|uniref:ABC transporter ATP-binding protein n=1 Tax=Thioclava sp. TaxID=1933450 RepID=UPI003AA9E0B9
MSALLEVDKVEAGYGDVQVLWGADMTVAKGETVLLMGVNGAGKTTLLRSLVGLQPCRGGAIRLNGEDISALKPEARIRRGMAYMSELGVFPTLSIAENLRLGAYTLSGSQARQRADQMYQMFPDLTKKRRAAAASLSGGQRKMLGLAKTLMSGADLILLDEPSSGLAPVFVSQVIETLKEVIGTGTSLLIAEQNIAFLALADRGYLMDHGRMAVSGTRAELEGSDAVRKAYFGVSADG